MAWQVMSFVCPRYESARIKLDERQVKLAWSESMARVCSWGFSHSRTCETAWSSSLLQSPEAPAECRPLKFGFIFLFYFISLGTPGAKGLLCIFFSLSIFFLFNIRYFWMVFYILWVPVDVVGKKFKAQFQIDSKLVDPIQAWRNLLTKINST